MTVREIIAELSKLDPDLEVYTGDSSEPYLVGQAGEPQLVSLRSLVFPAEKIAPENDRTVVVL